MHSAHRRSTHRWRRAVGGILTLALIVGACGGAAADTDDETTSETIPFVVPDGWDRSLITLNVAVSDEGFEPDAVFVPSGRGIQLVVRNEGSTEHHFRVIGLAPQVLLWASRPDTGVIEEGVSEEDHSKHHLLGFTDWRATSPLGVHLLGDEIHGYALPSEIEIMRFIVTDPGTYVFEDVLNRDMTGVFKVFERTDAG